MASEFFSKTRNDALQKRHEPPVTAGGSWSVDDRGRSQRWPRLTTVLPLPRMLLMLLPPPMLPTRLPLPAMLFTFRPGPPPPPPPTLATRLKFPAMLVTLRLDPPPLPAPLKTALPLPRMVLMFTLGAPPPKPRLLPGIPGRPNPPLMLATRLKFPAMLLISRTSPPFPSMRFRTVL